MMYHTVKENKVIGLSIDNHGLRYNPTNVQKTLIVHDFPRESKIPFVNVFVSAFDVCEQQSPGKPS